MPRTKIIKEFQPDELKLMRSGRPYYHVPAQNGPDYDFFMFWKDCNGTIGMVHASGNTAPVSMGYLQGFRRAVLMMYAGFWMPKEESDVLPSLEDYLKQEGVDTLRVEVACDENGKVLPLPAQEE